MASFKTKGTVKVINETQVISDKFKKREFVLTENEGQYPQDINFECKQDKVSLLDEIKEGQEIEVNFNLLGREWISPQNEAKYFNTLECWSLNVLSSIPEAIQKDEAEDDSLPF